MADFAPAVQKTLANEGGFFQNKTTGEVVNHGIGLWFLRGVGILKGSGPASADEIKFVNGLSVGAAKNLYLEYFWTPGHFALLDWQQLADKAFDLAVNCGLRTSGEMLQHALNLMGIECEIDGKIGPQTAACCNAANQELLYQHFILEAEARYHQIAERHPELAGNLDGWLARLHKT